MVRMSGPKYADFEIELQRLCIIKAQLEAQLERSKCAQLTISINKCIKNSEDVISKIDITKYEDAISAAEDVVKNKSVLNQLKKLVIELKSTIAESYAIKGNSKALTHVLHVYESRLKRVKNFTMQIDYVMCDLNDQYNEQRQENLELEFENMQWDTSATIRNVSQTLIDAYTSIIGQLMDCEEFDKEKAKYDAIMNNHAIDDHYKVSQMNMKFDAYLVEKQSDSGNNEEILELRSDYVALSNLIYGQCEKVPDDINILKAEIEEMFEFSEKQKQGEYVAACIDKVMKELGYSVVGNEVLETQKMTKQHYDYSADSAITVASSDSGAMMLEVVGKKNEDGSNGSVAAVRADMERFCPDYQKVKAGLQQYGIKLNDKKLCPPDEKYVRFADVKKTVASDRRITARNRKKRMYHE